jgi:hypothetical protein
MPANGPRPLAGPTTTSGGHPGTTTAARLAHAYFFFTDGHGAPQGAQAPAKSSGETARALDGLVR